jgi:hypothetical protein
VMDNWRSAEALECEAVRHNRITELWSILVYWVADAAGECCQC